MHKRPSDLAFSDERLGVGASEEGPHLDPRPRPDPQSRPASSFTEEDLFNWAEARSALDAIGRMCSMMIFIIVLIALYARLPRHD
jgi:hypothetical protein